MANYSLVIGSKFQPFSFERYLQPLQIYGQAYKEQEDALADLATKAATVESMANEQTDPESYAAYQGYANALKAQANSLATEGLTPTSRRAMLNMRKRYAQEVIPIQDAYNRRKEQAKIQADILAKDPTHFFGRMASTTSLDDYRNNKNLDLTLENYSGALLTQQVANEAAALAKAARNDPSVRTQLRHLLGFNYETIRQNGFSPEAVQEAILRSPNASPILTGIVDRVMAGSGIADWDYTSPEEKQRIWNKAVATASQGLWSAVGQTQYGTVVDDAAKMAAEYNNAVNLAREKYKIEHSNQTPTGFSSFRTVGNTSVLGDVDAAKKDIDFLDDRVKNGFKEEKTKVATVKTTAGKISVPYKQDDVADFRSMAKKYGVNLTKDDFYTTGKPKYIAVSKLKLAIKKYQDKLIQRSNDLVLSTTDDNANLMAVLGQNIWSSKKGNISWVREEREDGSTGDALSREEAITALTSGKNYNVRLSDNKIKVDYTDSEKKKPKTVILDPAIFGKLYDDNTRAILGISGMKEDDIGALLKVREQYMNSNDWNNASNVGTNIMNALYTLGNTRAYTQGVVGSVGTQIK